VTREEALERLARILAQPEFNRGEGILYWINWWQQVQRVVYDFVVGLWNSAADAISGQEGLLGTLLVGLALGALAAALIFVVRAVGLSIVRDQAQASRAARLRRERSDDLWRQAQELAAAGRFGEAMRALYFSGLYALEEHALLRVQESLTNREHAERVAREHPELRGLLTGVVERYDRFRYGHVQATAESVEELRTLVGQARAGTAA
jgi:hypothetical protein